MKKVFIIVLIISAFFSACKKEDKPAFDQSPDERLTETLAAYETQLTGAQNGWNGLLITDSGRAGTFSFYFKFNTGNRVIMLSDFDSLSAVSPKESSYRIKALQQPSLVFDTYSYIHVLSDPDETVNGGDRGAGLLADFEFYFDSVSTDVIKLVGRINGSKLTLTRASQAEADLYNNGGLAAGLNINKILTYFKRLTIGSEKYDIQINPLKRQITFTWIDANGTLQTFTTGYYSTAGGISFTSPVVNGSQTITGLNNISWNATSQTINVTVGSIAGTIIGIDTPLRVDVNAPARWWQFAVDNGNTFWISFKGFHVNGVDDAYNLQSLVSGTESYYFLLYWPAYATGNDFFGPVFINAAGTALSLQYGSAPRKPTFTSDGRAIFVELGTYGPQPATGPAGLTRDQLYSARGYYFVQTSANTYDMVSASDGKIWLTWEF